MTKKISCIAIFLSASLLFAEEPIADFSLDMSYFEKKSEKTTTETEPSKTKEVKTETTKNTSSDYYHIAEPKHKKIGITGINQESTKKYREKYLTTTNRQWLADILYNSIPYRPYIRAKLKEKKMPMYLQYLPIVESNYKPTAVSGSGATGLWQFMENSMHPYLKKTEYIDERLDPWKETDAALAKLADNYKMFKDWHLAIAAYNMGAGAVSRVIKANPKKDFWQLAQEGLLSKQASEYVPKLIAITDIIENADYYGAIEVGAIAKIAEIAPAQKFGYLKVKGSIKLSTIAKAAEESEEAIKLLNLELIKDCTPPNEVYKIRLPANKAKITVENLKKMKHDK